MLRLTKKPRLNLTKSAGDWGERVHKIEDWRDRWSPSQSLFFHYSLSPNSPSLPPYLPRIKPSTILIQIKQKEN